MDIRTRIIVKITTCAIASAVVLSASGARALAQSPQPAHDENNYLETQKLIDRTQARLDGINQANAKRAQEINQLNAKVNEVIGIISREKEANLNLTGEIGVLNQELKIERQMTASLRRELDAARKSLSAASSDKQGLAGDLKEAQLAIRSQKQTLQLMEKRVDALNREVGSLKTELAKERSARLKAERALDASAPKVIRLPQ